MRPHRIIFLSVAMALATGCSGNKQEVEAAKRSLYDADFSVVYGAALEVTRDNYPNLEDAPGRGTIKTAWHPVSYANNQDDLANPQPLSTSQSMASAGQASAGMPTRFTAKRFFIRFDVTIAGGRPWRLKVVGHAGMWEPGSPEPTELHGVARPSWLEGRTDSLLASIYNRVKGYAVPMKDVPVAATVEGDGRADPAAFKDVPPGAGKMLAALKDAAAGRDYPALRAQLADDVVWSLGGGTGADVAMATWQADPEPIEAMTLALAAGCAGDARRVTCPAGAPVHGSYQLVIEPRGDGWRVTSFVRAE